MRKGRGGQGRHRFYRPKKLDQGTDVQQCAVTTDPFTGGLGQHLATFLSVSSAVQIAQHKGWGVGGIGWRERERDRDLPTG